MQSASQTTVVASATTVVYGDSVLLDITAVSLNPAYLNLTTNPDYFAFIYGGYLDTGITIPLYPQFSKQKSNFLSGQLCVQRRPCLRGDTGLCCTI